MNFREFFDEESFLDTIFAEYPDVSPALIYADWLEERGDKLATYIRECLVSKKEYGKHSVSGMFNIPVNTIPSAATWKGILGFTTFHRDYFDLYFYKPYSIFFWFNGEEHISEAKPNTWYKLESNFRVYQQQSYIIARSHGEHLPDQFPPEEILPSLDQKKILLIALARDWYKNVSPH